MGKTKFRNRRRSSRNSALKCASVQGSLPETEGVGSVVLTDPPQHRRVVCDTLRREQRQRHLTQSDESCVRRTVHERSHAQVERSASLLLRAGVRSSSRCKRSIDVITHGGGRPRQDTTIIVANANGTDTVAG